ncbi:MAG: hypothetical protein AAF989_01965, partial [Planctomycetota bacterium]
MIQRYLLFALLAAAGICNGQAEIIANLDDEFNQIPSSGWAYLWNPTSIPIGDSTNYEALNNANNKIEIASVDVNDVLNSGNDAGEANATLGIQHRATDNVRWMLGGQNATGAVASTDGLDHYLIVAYTIQPGEAGDITLIGDFSSGSSAEFRAYVGDTLIDSTTFASNGQKDVNYDLGTLAEGDTVYFAMIGDSAQNRNTQRFFLQNGGLTLDRATA